MLISGSYQHHRVDGAAVLAVLHAEVDLTRRVRCLRRAHLLQHLRHGHSVQPALAGRCPQQHHAAGRLLLRSQQAGQVAVNGGVDACPAQSIAQRPRKSSLAAFNRRPPVEGLVQCVLHALVGAGLQAAVRQGILIDALQRLGPGLAQDGRGAHPCGVLHVGRVVHCAASGQTAGGKQGRQDQGGTFLVFQQKSLLSSAYFIWILV